MIQNIKDLKNYHILEWFEIMTILKTKHRIWQNLHTFKNSYLFKKV
jgi:hypothetical protein